MKSKAKSLKPGQIIKTKYRVYKIIAYAPNIRTSIIRTPGLTMAWCSDSSFVKWTLTNHFPYKWFDENEWEIVE